MIISGIWQSQMDGAGRGIAFARAGVVGIEQMKIASLNPALYLCTKSLVMFRTVVTPDKSHYQLLLTLPADYVGKELEVIVFAKGEGVVAKALPHKKVSFTVLKTKGKRFKFNREEANER